eukprot:1885978-Rhodomonas_salina.1
MIAGIASRPGPGSKLCPSESQPGRYSQLPAAAARRVLLSSLVVMVITITCHAAAGAPAVTGMQGTRQLSGHPMP